jgi:hypothetical protein
MSARSGKLAGVSVAAGSVIGTVGSAVSPIFGNAVNAHGTLASVSRNLLTVNTPVTLRPR